ncbi:MarR family transcriptional regulator [Clostridium sp. DJ247]|uniref:MarR family transcriptional regulator n=1 Tax=Clostridium sp. DJ247 TaxID=2726188 RepID=UPI0016271EFE|nr:MarR family transcriptional regulator [Clostridium sp. DJ247]MBC2578793.1 MarR family transcriptional regulator [Clostridium sp. DJ247]
MKRNDIGFQLHSFYNLSRYVFLKIEYTYNLEIEKHDITLPQLRVLWIIRCFPGISQDKIAKIGCWSPPTVSDIIKILFQKDLIYKEDTSNKKTHTLKLTSLGEEKILETKIKKDSNIALLKLLNEFSYEDLNLLSDTLKFTIITEDNKYILEYIERLNELELKFDFNDFANSQRDYIKKLVFIYNLIRIFVLTIQSKHSSILIDFNLTYPQLRALNIIKAFPNIISSELSKIGFWSKSTANLIVRNLYKKELIYKQKGNVKNSIHINISDKGESILSYDIKNNFQNIDIINTLKSLHNDLIYINSILSKMNDLMENDLVTNIILRTYEGMV